MLLLSVTEMEIFYYLQWKIHKQCVVERFVQKKIVKSKVCATILTVTGKLPDI